MHNNRLNYSEKKTIRNKVEKYRQSIWTFSKELVSIHEDKIVHECKKFTISKAKINVQEEKVLKNAQCVHIGKICS